ncbi:Flp family type IVb pilin [Sedimentitalea sp. HM32M-2]|uniref:Flp family type IVb pilin n=1 Tax=Sedimentitalea sp. HM32M-2 TaxID=3351566 RepID=UPI003628FC2A
MRHIFKTFLRSESGAVTVDWVVLTAAVVGLAIAVIASIQTATGGVGSSTGAYISSIEPG